ncbi:hypothetical protein DEO72_LG5g1186 [Vigna unguiculata]|uniref:Uncharacterized protein n=1 Tax=Vigna unguiculata TaxID=3917 RepID=A0A4D6LWR3_VIGUN|nr:hypothetical protein DEO72_LG5g1186 [Vigna unguiculata]
MSSVPSPFESMMRGVAGSSRPLVQEVCNTYQAKLDFESKKLQSIMKEKAYLLSESGVLADKISPGVLKTLITLNDKRK